MTFFIALGILVILSVVSFFLPLKRDLKFYLGQAFLGVIAVVYLLVTCSASVPTGHIGLIYSFGALSGQKGEGLQFVAPWQTVKYASIQTQGKKFEKMMSFSSETQQVTVTATINVRVIPDHIRDLYRTVGDDYFNVIVAPRVLQAFKDETVKYSSIDIAPKREVIRCAVRDKLAAELQENYSILVTDLLIDDISFGDEFEKAIEEKQRQTQLALAEKEKVVSEKSKADQAIERARGEAQATIINADAQSASNKKMAESLSPELIQYTYAQKLSPNIKVMMIPNTGGFILDPSNLKE